MCVDVDIEWLCCRMLGDRCRLESRETKGVMLFLGGVYFVGWRSILMYCAGGMMRLQKPWVHITVSRSIAIDIPDLASRIPVAYHVASGSFGGNGKKPYSHGL